MPYRMKILYIIAGANGSGKSTLLGLLSGVFTPYRGEVVFKSSKMSYVGVTPHIIKGSIKENQANIVLFQ